MQAFRCRLAETRETIVHVSSMMQLVLSTVIPVYGFKCMKLLPGKCRRESVIANVNRFIFILLKT